MLLRLLLFRPLLRIEVIEHEEFAERKESEIEALSIDFPSILRRNDFLDLREVGFYVDVLNRTREFGEFELPLSSMKDRSPEILRFVSTILAESAAARGKAQSANPAAFDKRRVASELLVILHAADELVAFFNPPINPIEYHGVPRSMTELEDEPHLVVRSEEGLNFLP